MKPLLISVLLFIPFALGARYYFVCQTLQWCDRTTLAYEVVEDLDLLLPDGSMAALRFGEYPEGAVMPPRTTEMLASMDSLAAYAHRFPDYLLTIEGPVTPSERGSSDYYRDLGLARSAELAGNLQRRGIPGERLELYSYPVADNESRALRVGFEPIRPVTVNNALPTGETLLDSTVLLGLRFETNSTALSPTEDLTAYASELVDVLNAEPELSLTLIGHTDDHSSDAHNDSLGLWRAQAVAAYIIHLGYNREINTLSHGELKPIATNSTQEGRFLNRRVEVRID
ncbi:MAG: OmpA family protein [Saprospiraceae bacterium]